MNEFMENKKRYGIKRKKNPYFEEATREDRRLYSTFNMPGMR